MPACLLPAALRRACSDCQPGNTTVHAPPSLPAGGTLTSLDTRVNVTASGRFSIDVSPDPPATLGQPGTNWLRQDFPDAPVQFVFRIYWGDESVRRNTYRLPPIRRVGGADRAVADA